MLDIIRWQMEHREKEINYVESLYSNGHRWQGKAVWALHRLRGERKKEQNRIYGEKCNLKEQWKKRIKKCRAEMWIKLQHCFTNNVCNNCGEEEGIWNN
jgi:hypothetical protein